MVHQIFRDEVTIATAELNEYLDSQAKTIAQPSTPQGFDKIRDRVRDAVREAVERFERAAFAAVESELKKGRVLLEMKKVLKRSEYKTFLYKIGWTSSKASKQIALCKTFEGFSLPQIGRIALSTLLALCGKAYTAVVEQMRDMHDITQEAVERLMKECRPPRRPKPKEDPTTGWRRDRSGGGRHYAVHLYDELTAMEIEQIAQEEQVLPQRVIADALAAKKQVAEMREELRRVVDEVRGVQIEMQRQIIQLLQQLKEKDEQIEELQSKLGKNQRLEPD